MLVVASNAEDAVPRVSIVVPAYNRERYIGAAIESVQAQTVSQWELVVFDDGSQDGTVAVSRRYADADPRIQVRTGPNGGAATARNRGFAATDERSEFVVFLDSDDVWEPDALEVLTGALGSHPDHVSAYGLVRCIDPDGRPVPGDDLEDRMRERVAFRDGRLQPVPPEEPTTFAGLVYHNWVVTAGIHLVRRSKLARVGLFDPDTDPADDWDMAVRISRLGPIGFVPRVVLHWRRHDDTLTQSSTRWRRGHHRVRQKMVADAANTPEQRRLAALAYREQNRQALETARTLVGKRDLTGAARHVASAAMGFEHYLRATAPLRWARSAR